MKKKIQNAFMMLSAYFLMTVAVYGQSNPGTGVITVAPTNGSCGAYTPAQGNGPDNWEVAEGGTYTMTITGVTECAGSEITVFIQSSSSGNWCFNASGGNGTYTGEFTMPASTCHTMPISYKCGADQSCNAADSYDADGPSGNGLVHLRASNFDGNCIKTSTDSDCNTCVAEITITPDGSTAICEGSCVTLTAEGGVTYLWSTGETGNSIEVCEAGTYSVVGVDENNCTGESAEIEVTVNEVPEVSVDALGNTSICPNSCVTLVASGAATYVWSPGGETTESIEACEAATYSVIGTGANGCTSASEGVEVLELLPPKVDVLVDGPTTVCSPDCVTLNATGAETYVWSPNGETTSSISACATGTYSVVGTGANGCTAGSNSVDVTINTPPTVGVTADGPTTVCSPNCVTLNASGATNYVWSPGGQTTNSIQACATGTYSVVGTDANGCTDASDNISITITPTPSCSLSVPTTLPVCGLSGNTLTASVTGVTTSKVWTVTSSNNSWQILSGQGTNTITYKAGTSGTTGTFTLVVSNGVCTSNCTVTFGSNCAEYCGYTQGFYSGTGKICDGTKTAIQTINAALTSGGNMVLGGGTRTVTILSTEGSCLNSKMPAGTTATFLPVGSPVCSTATGNAYINSGKFKPVLLGQVIALTINVRNQAALGNVAITGTYLTTYGASACSNGTAVPGTKKVYPIHQNVINCLGAANTVNDLLALGNKALANAIPAGCTATAPQINDAIDAINNGFDKCRILAGFGSSSSGIRLMDGENSEPVNTIQDLSISVMPNPLSESSVVYFEATENAHAVIEIFTINGARVSSIFNEDVQAGQPYGIEMDVTSLKPGIYFIKANIGSQTAVQKVVVMTK